MIYRLRSTSRPIYGTLRAICNRRLASSATPEAEKLLLKVEYPIDRENPLSALNLHPQQVSDALRERSNRHKLTTSEQRIRVNLFLNALALNDISGALGHLLELRTRCKNGILDNYVKNREAYTSCLISLLTYLLTENKQDLDLKTLNLVLREVNNLPLHVRTLAPEKTKEINVLALLVLFQAIKKTQDSKKQLQMSNLVTFARDFATKSGVEYNTVLELIRSQSPSLINAFNLVFRRQEVARGAESTVDAYKGKNSLTLGELTSFISDSKFDISNYTEEDFALMWEAYDELDGDTKEQFMREYLEHNRKRQLFVEANCTNLHFSSTKQAMMSTFDTKHARWLTEWHEQVRRKLEKVAQSDEHMKKYSYFLSAIDLDELVSVVFSHMLANTLCLEHTSVLRLMLRLRYAMYQLIKRQQNLRPIHGQIEHFLNEDDGLDFMAGVVKVVIDVCRIEPNEIPSDASGRGFDDQLFILDQEIQQAPFKTIGVIKMHPFISESLKVYDGLLHAGKFLMPMLCPPKEWTHPKSGGFLTDMEPMMKSSDPKHSLYHLERAHETGQLDSIYKSLQALGETAWVINPDMARIFLSMMDQPNGFAHIPPDLMHLNPPPKLSPPKRDKFDDTETFKKALAVWKRERAEQLKEYNEKRSLRMRFENLRNVVKAFSSNGDIFFLPHNLDFRGRVYPIVSELSHHSEDLVRSLLLFWEPKPLGKDGFRWLEYQLANCHSVAKLDLEELSAYVEKHRKDIVEAVNRPNNPTAFYKSSSAPWQCLALCVEMTKIWEWEKKHPRETYLTRMPVQQDGTCNGLQHYAALGGDIEAAASVNLTPSHTRQDVYDSVASRVMRQIEKDIDSDSDQIASLAQEALPTVSRKLVKHTVMTTVYGLTKFGAWEQIREKLHDILDETHREQMSATRFDYLLRYIAEQILEAILSLFPGARKVQHWLCDNCLRFITSYEIAESPPKETINFLRPTYHTPMMWTSLSGLPVVQNYRIDTSRKKKTPLQLITLNDHETTKIDKRRQITGIAPNFIHSLDAMHLMMTCLQSKAEGITFAGVHDSFWTHPSDVNKLYTIIRQEFVRLYQSEIIENFQMDLEHLTKNRLQLVYVDNEKDAEFAAALGKLRSQRAGDIQKKSPQAIINGSLTQELHDNISVLELVEKFQPTFYFGRTLKCITLYDKTCSHGMENVELKHKTPLLVPVQLAEPPEVGRLDITQVMKSRYFFS